VAGSVESANVIVFYTPISEKNSLFCSCSDLPDKLFKDLSENAKAKALPNKLTARWILPS